MVNIVNQGTLGGGFRHYSGLLPAVSGSGDSQARASVRVFHVPAANAAAIFRGDIVTVASGVAGGDLPANISAPSASVVIGNGGGSGLGNRLIAPDVARYTPGTNLNAAGPKVAGVVVGFGPVTLYMAKNGFQYVPALTEAWLFVETDPNVEMYITQPAIQGATPLFSRFDVLANAGQQSTRFGISGVSLAAAALATAPLQLISSGEQIGNDVAATGNVAKVKFHPAVHIMGSNT
jgi:hypothetical protein